MQPLIIGFFAMAGYGLFLLFRALARLYRAGEKKLVCCVIGYMLIAPFPVWLVAKMPVERFNIWLVLPAFVLFGIWICLGYFMESYRKKREQEKQKGCIARVASPRGFFRRNILVLVAGLLIWLYGAFVGINDRNVEMVLLCVSLFLLTTSLGSFWRYRKF